MNADPFDVVMLCMQGSIILAFNIKFLPDAVRIMLRRSPKDEKAVHIVSAFWGRFLGPGPRAALRKIEPYLYVGFAVGVLGAGVDCLRTVVTFLVEHRMD